MKKLPTLLVAIALSLGLASSLRADFSQEFNESGVGPFDHFAVDNASGTMFASPATAFSDASWTSIGDLTHLQASGNSLNSLNFVLSFTSDNTTPFSLLFTAWNGEVVVDSAIGTWDPTSAAPYGWTFTATEKTAGYSVPDSGVPVALMGAIMLALIAVRRRIF